MVEKEWYMWRVGHYEVSANEEANYSVSIRAAQFKFKFETSKGKKKKKKTSSTRL